MTDHPDLDGGPNAHRVAAAELSAIIGRIERLREDRAEINAEIANERRNAKLKGYDLKAIDEMVKLRALDPEKREEREALRQMYADAIGLFD